MSFWARRWREENLDDISEPVARVTADAGTAPRQLPVARGPIEPLVAIIDARLRAMLADGVLAAGAKLNENALAQQMQVSRSALREAVRRLEQSALVTIIPNRGVFIRQLALPEMFDLFDVHAGLARSAGRLVASRIGADQLQALEQCQSAMAAALANGNIEHYRKLNGRFHQDLFTFAGNARLSSLHEMIATELQLSRRHNLGTLHQLRSSVLEHGRILEGIRAGDEARTARAFEQHVLNGKSRMLDTVGATEMA